MNTQLRKKANNGFDKGFFKLMNNSVSGKIMENVRNQRDIKLVTNKRRINLVSQPNYYSTKKFSEELIPIEIKKKNKNKNG